MHYFGYFLLRNTVCYPDRPAAVFGEQIYSYRQLNNESNRLANGLKKLGLGRGDRLAMLMHSGMDWLLVWYACQKLGIAVVPLHVRLLPGELARILELARVSALIYSGEYAQKAANMAQSAPNVRHFICCDPSEAIPDPRSSPWPLVAEADATEAQVELSGDDESVILFTSGTTGVSKGVLRTQQVVCDHALVLAIGNEGDNVPEVMLTPAPLYHTAGLFCVLKTAALAGTLVLVDGFRPEQICEQIQQHRVTQLLLVPPVSYQRLKQSEAVSRYDLSSVKLALVTAGKCTRECMFDIFSLFPQCCIRPSWGSTEVCSATGSNLTREELEAHPERMNTIGKVNCMVEIRLVDENGKDVAAGAMGEALVRSPMVFDGYLGDPETTAACFDGKWFKTEDILRRDEEGFYYLLDRKRDIVKTGGENVYSQEVERVLQNYPPILDSAVIGVADPRFEEAIAAAVVLREGHTLDTEDFIRFCRENLPAYKKPRYLAVMEQLPKNSVGKVQKNILREKAGELFKPLG